MHAGEPLVAVLGGIAHGNGPLASSEGALFATRIFKLDLMLEAELFVIL